ncbi:delta-lactam-biosynthetic de-N-acetylase [Paenibacillus oleatilyticus]|uniref:delta-lactam-biosynthetic de-N-acetylase n=1 Tax=Paenibacillus oleatilyticus TaxID=2594886 RepID=UPI001C1F769E|nr:polysaccharide deacetylase family protein [Paenibacillus oleatilyticus]MBU7318044.1 polysaccharide deacetylase family protein [Paenibacillus oleatilyticus]
MNNKTKATWMLATALSLMLAACGNEHAAEPPAPTESPKPTETPKQTDAKKPVESKKPSDSSGDSSVVPAPPVTSVNSGSAKDAKAEKEKEKETKEAKAKETKETKATKDKPTPSESADKQNQTPGATEAVSDNGKAGASGPKNPAAAVTGGKTKEPPATGTGDRKALSWYYMKKPKGQVPNFPAETKSFTKDMKALWVGTGKKVYLTIDTGGPLGDIDTLVKSLKDNKVKANFFIAGYNVKKNPDFIRTLVADGHLIANHTMTHTDMNTQTDEQVRKEIEDYEKLYKDVTGKDIQPYFRFPYGRYNTHLLKMVSDMGYTSVFWSTAMRDWEPRKNGAEDPYNDIMNNLHDGNIILMHQGSPENIQALDKIIKAVKKAGYEFALLSDIEPPK